MSLALLTELAKQQAYKNKSTQRKPVCEDIYAKWQVHREVQDFEICMKVSQFYTTSEILCYAVPII